MQGYYRFPAISNDAIAFVCEDDIWSVSKEGGSARRLTVSLSEASRPAFSPDGNWLAFTAREEGHPEVYVMPASGGEATRLTYHGALTTVIGWTPEGQILYTSTAGRPIRETWLWTLDPTGGEPTQMRMGPANHLSFGPNGAKVLGRHTLDPARWKRYRGGTAGALWIDRAGDGNFERLTPTAGNLTAPMWINERIYFISDHEGIGNLYSCLPDNTDLQRHTHHEEYYCRFPSTDGKQIVYHAGADIYLYDVASGQERKVPIALNSPRTQTQRKFVDTEDYWQDYDLHPQGHSLALTVRGKPFHMGNWDGAVTQFGESDGVRYRLLRYLKEGKRFVAISDANGEERLEVHEPGSDTPSKNWDAIDIGHVYEMKVSPTEDQVALINHRMELMWVDLNTGESKTLDRSKHHFLNSLSWSPDGQWIAYDCAETERTRSLKICRPATGEHWIVTPPEFQDLMPDWDPEGNYLYFVSFREYAPVYDHLQFDLGFPRAMRPMLVTLRKDTPHPLMPEPQSWIETPPEEGKKTEGNEEAGAKPKPVEIDFDEIHKRVVALPFPEGEYQQIAGLPNGKMLVSSFPQESSLNTNGLVDEADVKGTLHLYDFKTQKSEEIITGISHFILSRDRKTMAYRAGKRLRVLKAGEKPDEKELSDKASRLTGWVDLNRARCSVVPTSEWQQMYREAWRLQRDYFWVEDMSKVDWERVYQRYYPLLERVATRAEFSDLMWEMQGELGTSHCYEMGGDYRSSPNYAQGFLGADFAWDEAAQAYRITHIVNGDAWNDQADSPFNEPGVHAQIGDYLIAINDRRLSKTYPPGKALTHTAGQAVKLTLQEAGGQKREATVKTLNQEMTARYREWVCANRDYVRRKTNGQAGYVHIPDMGARGYAEFHRSFLAEVAYPCMVVDVRNNGGGHVSQLLLEKLARKRIGYDIRRWGTPEPYPTESVMGPMVAVTDERAGSDGDIFSHSFKLMKLGTLIGKRTWGGVIGIWPRSLFVDGGLTTQPGYSFWFQDVGWSVENYGTDPDIDVDYRPQDYANRVDPQLDTSIEVLMKQMEENPPRLPDFGERPNLSLPRLNREG